MKKIMLVFLVFCAGFVAGLFAANLTTNTEKDFLGRSAALPISEDELKRLENNQSTPQEIKSIMQRLEKYNKEATKRISNDEIVYFYHNIVKDSFPSATVSVVSREYLGKTQYEKVIVEIAANGQKIQDKVFVHEQYILPDIIDVPQAKSLKADEFKEIERVKRTELDTNVLKALKDEDKVVSLGKKGQWGKEIIVFSDPECPYCQKHLQGIDERFLQDNRIHFIFVSVHGKSAFEKVALIYKETAKAQSDSAKLAIIKKYFDGNVKYAPPSEVETKQAEILFSKYMLMGLRQVPYIIELDEKGK